MELLPGKELNEIEQGIMDFLQRQASDVTNLPIQELAIKTYSSNTTIVRFCKKFGYKGYRDFRIAFVQEVEANKYMKKTVDFSVPFTLGQSPEEILHIIAAFNQENVALLERKLDLPRLIHASSELARAERIFIFAIGDSLLTCQRFVNRVLKIGIMPIVATERREEQYYGRLATPKDAALIVSYSGSDSVFGSISGVLNENGVPIIAITANRDSAIFKRAKWKILIPHEEDHSSMATFFSQNSFNFVLDILYCLLYNRSSTKVRYRAKEL